MVTACRFIKPMVKLRQMFGEACELSDAVLMESLYTLTLLLRKHYGSRVIVLTNEYDVPLSKANDNGDYAQMVFLIRNMFE